MAQSRYLFAVSCFQMDLLSEAEAALCPANEPSAEVVYHFLFFRFIYYQFENSRSIFFLTPEIDLRNLRFKIHRNSSSFIIYNCYT